MAFAPKKRITIETGNESCDGGYDVINFIGPEWEALARTFPCRNELAMCLIWMKNTTIYDNKIFFETAGIQFYVMQNLMWNESINRAMPNYSILVNASRKTERTEKTKYRYQEGDSSRATHGLSLQINHRPIIEFCPNTINETVNGAK